MSLNIDVLDVDRGGESFERIVVKVMQRGQQSQIFRNALRQGLPQTVILNRQRHEVTEHLKRFQRVYFVGHIARAASQRNDARQFPPDLERADALEQLGCDIAIGTEEDIVLRSGRGRRGESRRSKVRSGQRYRSGDRRQSVNLPRQ